MKHGQMSISKLSQEADYLQLDICGLSKDEAINRYNSYNKNISVILHGDWTKKGFSEDNIVSRFEEYISIIKELKTKTTVLGITIHPPKRKKVSFDQFLSCCKIISKETNVFIENRSSDKLWLSLPDEIIQFSQNNLMTIDLPQLYICCKYDELLFSNTIKKINWNNVHELHIANIKRKDKHTFVGRSINDGEINFSTICDYIKNIKYYTYEILGGVSTFEKNKDCINSFFIMP